MTNEKQEEFAAVVDSLHNALLGNSMKENEVWIRETINKYKPDCLSNPDNFNVLINFSLTELADLMFQTLYGNGFIGNFSEENQPKVESLFLQFDFIEKHLDKLIVQENTWICSHDKLVFLTSAYLKELQGKEIIWNTKNYWVPDAGTKEQWFEFIEGIIDLATAKDLGERAVIAKKAIEEAYSTKREEEANG